MFDLKTTVTALIVSFVVLFGALTVGLVGDNQSDGVGGYTRLPNSDFSAQTITSNGAFTSTGAATFSSTINATGETTVDGFTEGGGTVTVTPVTTSVTLTQANLLAGNIITFTASSTQGVLTVTLPATSTMTTLLASDGDTRSWMIENPFTAAATTTTLAAGTGIDLQEPDGQNVVVGINNYAWLTCFREASTDVVCRVDETIPAD